MKRDPVFLSTPFVLAIHGRMVREFGGDASVRDAGLLDAAITVPKATFGGQYLHRGIPAMAAAYLFHICKNHPFVDGNKRTALATAEVFLQLNHRRLAADNDRVFEMTIGVADGSIDKDTVTSFFRKHVKR
jgi:death-on-curing protein